MGSSAPQYRCRSGCSPLPGLQEAGVFTLRNLTDMDAIQAWIEQHNIAHTTLVGGIYRARSDGGTERKGDQCDPAGDGEQVMAPVDPEMASALHQEIRSHGVDLRLRTALTEVLRTETGFRVALSDGGFLQTDMVILAIGVKPESSLATGAGLAVGKRGGISVNACMQTSILTSMPWGCS